MTLWNNKNVYQALLTIIALVFGSLTGVLIKRIPAGENFVLARSKCPHCNYQLKWYENIPIISYVILLAKCSNCKEKISSFYPIIEIVFLLCAFPFIQLAVKRFQILSGFIDQSFIFLDFLFYMGFIAIALALGVIDFKTKQLPHLLTYAGIILGVIYVSLFGSPFYQASESLNFLPGFLVSSFSAIKQFAIIVFSLDIVVFFVNLLVFRENALLEVSNALSFGQKKLQENMKLVYLLYLVFVLALIYFNQYFVLEIFFVLLGLLYLVFEILPFFSVIASPQGAAISMQEEIPEGKKTILGGGDIVMLGFFATLLGMTKTFLVFLSSFYVAFIFLLLKIIKRYFDFQIALRDSNAPDQDKTFDIVAILRGNIALGLALAISFIAVMMMLAK
jgi:hypothetical protein